MNTLMQSPNLPPKPPDAVTVLIADDEPHIRYLVGNKLKRAGYHVLIASNGQECLALAQQQKPALIVTDFQMPMLSGYDMSVRLAQNPATADIPIILLTARGHKLSDEQLSATGIRDLMDKPFSPIDLVNRVQALLCSQAA